MAGTLPDYVVFNRPPHEYVREPLTALVGDRVRFPGEFPFVNHGFGHVKKGAIRFLDFEDRAIRARRARRAALL